MQHRALRPARGAGSRSRFLVASLVLLVGLAGLLTFQAQQAERSHRATAERALRDYASVAVWGLRNNAQEAVFTLLAARLDSVWGPIKGPVALGGVPLERTLGPSTSELCHCLLPDQVGTRFVLTGAGRLVATGPLSAGLESLIRDSLVHRSGARRDKWLLGVVFPAGDTRAVGYARRRVAAGPDAGALVGFVAQRSDFAAMFSKLVDQAPVLPTPLLRGPNESTFSVEVFSPDGRPVFRTPRVYAAAYSASDTVPAFFGGLKVRVAVRPSAAEHLLIGGLPRSRLPLLLSVLALSIALAVVALLQLRREAELARMREDFVSSVSHELRTPLAQIRMFAETLLLGRTRSEAERRRSLEIIDQEARRLSALVENVLQYSRASRGVTRVVPETADLTMEVGAVAEGFRVFTTQKRMELKAELQDGVMGMVDRGALRQMLNNLLENAVKYGPAGQRVVVGLALFGEAARMWVDDEGPGIPAEEREKVFAPFYRSPRDAGSAVAGSGIGLAVVRELASLHAGRVWAEEAPGGGARVTIEIPGAYVRHPVPAGDTAAA